MFVQSDLTSVGDRRTWLAGRDHLRAADIRELAAAPGFKRRL